MAFEKIQSNFVADCRSFKTSAEFDRLHGDCVVVGRFVIFSDGYRRENASDNGMIFPPQDQYEQAENILLYWQTRLQRVVDEFADMKAILQTKANSGMPNPTQAERSELESLHREVLKLKGIVDEAEKAVEKSIPKQQRERTAQMNANRIEGLKISEELDKLEV